MAGNPFEQAFLKNREKLEKQGLQVKKLERTDQWETDPKRVPMMYRAQVKERCSLHNAKRDNQDLDKWTEEWVNPKKNREAKYQRSRPVLGQEGNFYRVEVEFPFRLFSNGGQDSIARPMLGKDGIPFLPGSSVKGLFVRGCGSDQIGMDRVAKYCGGNVKKHGKMEHLPGSLPLRFHGAYPLGNWADRVVDLVHPQGNRQVGTGDREERSTASALISLYQPRMVFEFSCDAVVNWEEVRFILMRGLEMGVGGKTSSGYGLGGGVAGQPAISPRMGVSVLLEGSGVSSLLRDGTPEFRPNLFKAGLRGHLRRLLGGVDENKVGAETDRWFGNTKAPAAVKLLWHDREAVRFEDVGLKDRNPFYRVSGMLYADIDKGKEYEQDVALLEQVVRFAYVMGGFGKSWRRVWHEQFKPDYHKTKFAIGCHWTSSDWDEIQSVAQLKGFLNDLYGLCCGYLGKSESNVRSADWREAWNPKRVAVFCRVGNDSGAIGLFHDDVFKTTMAIGGKMPGDDRPTGISSVWHRMLPLKNGTEFLEIVTVFHTDRKPWSREGVDQLHPFIKALQERKLVLCWGQLPAGEGPKKRIIAPIQRDR